MRINKNYYNFSFGAWCGVIVGEKTMRKIAALQTETRDKLLKILENSEDVHAGNWSIADKPEEFSQDRRIFHYVDDSDPQDRLLLTKEIFGIKKAGDLYFVNGKYIEARLTAQAEHEAYLASISGETSPERAQK